MVTDERNRKRVPRNLNAQTREMEISSRLNKYRIRERSVVKACRWEIFRRNQRRVIVPEEKNRLAKKFESRGPILSLVGT